MHYASILRWYISEVEPAGLFKHYKRIVILYFIQVLLYAID